MCSLVSARCVQSRLSCGLQQRRARQLFVAIPHWHPDRLSSSETGSAINTERLRLANEMLDKYKVSDSVVVGGGGVVKANGLPVHAQNMDKYLKNVNKHDMELNVDCEYEKAINCLNSLQSNAVSLRQAITANCKENVLHTVECLEHSGLSLDDLDKLSIIHVSGTKGKGSTCAITESILRCHGVRTGFFSSPHLISVTERIRINGEPIAKEKFVQHFWRVYNRLERCSSESSPMPAYFKFLTILSFHIFLAERVDVVILEVGIGGELDCTNIVRNTKTVGITSLGLEHTKLLGDSLEEIAWQKSGIIKPNSNVFTYVEQPECLGVLQNRANEKNASLHIVPDFKSYSVEPRIQEQLAQLNDVIQLNGSLAIQLAYDWLRRHKFQNDPIDTTQIREKVLSGLLNCQWPGRCERIKLGGMNIHLDGAHTVESMRVCRDWFQRVTSTLDNNHSTCPKVLVFNTTGDRDAKKLLEILHDGPLYKMACFVPNISSGSANKSDLQTVHSIRDQLQRSRDHADAWRSLSSTPTKVFGSVLDALNCVHQEFLAGKPSSASVDIIVTGSIHLIGATAMALQELQRRVDPKFWNGK